jgi:hypothetical protein
MKLSSNRIERQKGSRRKAQFRTVHDPSQYYNTPLKESRSLGKNPSQEYNVAYVELLTTGPHALAKEGKMLFDKPTLPTWKSPSIPHHISSAHQYNNVEVSDQC